MNDLLSLTDSNITSTIVSNNQQSIQTLIAHGARHLITLNIVDLSKIPLLQNASSDYRQQLTTTCKEINMVSFNYLIYFIIYV
jgi:phospholipase/lecithinase/hemolysin